MSEAALASISRVDRGARMRMDGRAEFPRPREKREHGWGSSSRLFSLSRGRRRSDGRAGRQVSQAKIGNYEQQKSPRFPVNTVTSSGASGTRRVIYISPCTYLPTYPSRVLCESIQPFLRHWRNAREGRRGDEEAQRLQGGRTREAAATSFHYHARSLFFNRINCVVHSSFFTIFSFFFVSLSRREDRDPQRTSQNNRVRQLRSW